MNKHEENPSPENDQDAAALFTKLASQDSNDSAQASDEDTLDGNEEESSDSEESNQGSDEQGQADDPWAQVDEDRRNEYLTLQANHSKLQNDHKANAGRVQALNQKVAEFQKQVEQSEQSSGKQTSNGPTADDLEGMSFEEVEQEWPEVAGYLKRQLQQTQQQLTKQFEERLSPFSEMQKQQQQAQKQQHITNELERLKQIHPDYQSVANDSKFHQWVNSQPDTVKAMAQSTYAADNIVLLNLYKGRSSNSARSTRSNLSDHAVIPKKGSGQRIQTDPNNIDPVQLFAHLASKKK